MGFRMAAPQTQLPEAMRSPQRHVVGRQPGAHLTRLVGPDCFILRPNKSIKESLITCHAKARPSSTSTAGGEGRPATMERMPQTGETADPQLQERLDFVKRHFQYTWKDVITKKDFADNIYFEDPQTKINGFQGYRAFIFGLRNFLAPIYELHDIRPYGEHGILVHWTFNLQFWFQRWLPSKFIWDPRMVFSGTTELAYDPRTGKFVFHRDRWDALRGQEQDFFSWRAFTWTFSQMLNLSQAPNLETPECSILKKYINYEVRRYYPFTIVTTDIPGGTESGTSEEGGATFAALERYFEGENEKGVKLEKTTPRYTLSSGAAQMYVAEGSQAPKPTNSSISLRRHPGGLYAAVVFAGWPHDSSVLGRKERLRADIKGDNLKTAGDDVDEWVLAVYNGRWTLPPWRRNEVLIPLNEDSFVLWEGKPAP